MAKDDSGRQTTTACVRPWKVGSESGSGMGSIEYRAGFKRAWKTATRRDVWGNVCSRVDTMSIWLHEWKTCREEKETDGKRGGSTNGSMGLRRASSLRLASWTEADRG